MFKVELDYFSGTGKWKYSGEYLAENSTEKWEVDDEIRSLIQKGHRPGIVSCEPGSNEYFVLVRVQGELVPKLIIPCKLPELGFTNCTCFAHQERIKELEELKRDQ